MRDFSEFLETLLGRGSPLPEAFGRWCSFDYKKAKESGALQFVQQCLIEMIEYSTSQGMDIHAALLIQELINTLEEHGLLGEAGRLAEQHSALLARIEGLRQPIPDESAEKRAHSLRHKIDTAMKRILEAPSLESCLYQVMRHISRVVNGQECQVLLRDPLDRQFYIEATPSRVLQHEKSSHLLNHPVIRQLIDLAAPQSRSDDSNSTQFALPVRVNGELCGIIYFQVSANDRDRLHAFCELLLEPISLAVGRHFLQSNFYKEIQYREQGLNSYLQRARIISDQIEYGVFLFSSNRQCTDQYTLALERILGLTHLTGKDLLPLIFSESDSSATEKLDRGIDSFFQLRFETAAALIPTDSFPKELRRGKQTFEINWIPLKEQAKEPRHMMVILRNITEIRSLGHELETQNRQILDFGLNFDDLEKGFCDDPT